MFLITLKNEKKNGAFSIINQYEEKVLLFFEEFDDAERYRILLDEQDFPEMEILEYDDELLTKTADAVGYNYSIIGPYDLVVPPDTFKV
jgi:hypothetical protein